MTGRIMQIPLRLLQYARAAVPGGAAGAKLMAKPHGAVAKALHWGTAGMLLYAYIRNGDVTGALDSPSAMNREIMFGLAAGALFAGRFFWMRDLNGGPSRLPSDAPRWEHLASKLILAAAPGFAVAAIGITLLTMGLNFLYGIGNQLVQERAPDALRGRVSAVAGLSFVAVLPFSGLMVSSLDTHFGMRTTLVICATGYAILAAFILARRWPQTDAKHAAA